MQGIPSKIKFVCFIIFVCGLGLKSFGQTTIASDGLNNSTSLFTLSNGAYYTGNSASGDRPASSAFASEGSHSRGAINTTATLTSSDINTSGYNTIQMTISVAAFSIGSTGNGMDGTDILTVEVSPNGGTNYYSTCRILGNTNAYWAYSATGNASTTYDGNATPVDFTPAGGGSRTTDGYSLMTITNLPATTNLRVRITMLNNATAEQWVVDDFKVTGISASGPEINIQGNSTTIVDGDATPTTADHSDFSSACVTGGTVVRTFTIQNTGVANLTVSSIALSGTNAADFTIGGITLPATIAAAASTTFTVTFDPSASGTRSATVTVNNDDTNEASYDFAVQGTGTAPSISTSAISGSPFCVSSSATATVSVPFTSTCATFGGANVFTAELSSSTGSFASPTSIGTLSSSATSGTISATIPVSTATGTSYRIRVVASAETSAGAVTGSDNGTNLTINLGPANVTGLTATVASGQTVLAWTNVSCYDKVLVVGNTGSVTVTPTGDGSAYSGSTTFGSGTALAAGQYAIYKNTSNTVTVTNLTNGTNYCFKVFTLKGTTWSSGTEVCVTPSISYCTAASTDNTYEYIQNVTLNTINNSTLNSTYTNYTAISTTLERTMSYPLTVYVGDYYSTDICLAWIDWNNDGDFVDAGEQVMNLSTSAPYNATVTVPAGATLGTTRMRLRLYDSGAGTSNTTPCGTHTYGEVEDYSIVITDPCVATHTVTSFAPSSGPVGTDVTITGTGFTSAATVSFNGVAATSVTFVNSTTIIAEMPATGTTGLIAVSISGCAVKTGSNFTLIEESGACLGTSSFTDLIISEVYDSDAGNVAYIELYNPTASAINLATAGYQITFDNRASGDPGVTIDRTINLTGTVAAGGVFLLNLGTSSNTCTNTWNFTSGGAGFNADDYIFLVKSGTNVDRVNLPGNTGYSWIRKGTAVGPTVTYNVADWTTSNTESCADLGLGPVSGTTSPTLSAISDVTACSLDYTVTVTEGNTTTMGDVTYKWYYNDGVSATWTQVTAGAPAGLTITGSTTNHLQITSNTSSISTITGYQFYCEVTEAGTCKNVGNAADFSFGPQRYFRSNVTSGSGTWNNAAYWEMATSSAGPWSAACDYPIYSNSDYIHILSGDVMNVTADITLDQVEIESGGTIDIGINSQITLNDGTGIDLQVDGTLIDNNVSVDQIIWNGSATWSLGSAGTIVKTGTSSVINYKNNYSGGISTIPSTAYWIYRYTAAVASVTSASVGMYYPNLTFESTSGFHNFSGSAEKLTGSSDYCRVKGNMDVGGSGSGTVKVYNLNTNVIPMTISGNLTIGTGSTLINDDATDIGTGFDLKGNLTVNGTLTINAITNTDATPDPVMFQFSGTGTQTIAGSGTNAISCGIINNTSVGGLVITNSTINLNFTNKLTLTDGVITTNNNKVTLSSTTASDLTHSTGNASFINGNLRRSITSNTSTYELPLGDGINTTNYKRADLINNNLNGIAYIDAFVNSITESSPNDDATFASAGQIQDQNGSGLPTPLDLIMEAAQWDLTPNTTTFTGDYGVKLYTANTGLSGSDDNTFCPVKRASNSTTYADWVSLDASTTIPANGAAGRIYNSGNGYAQRLGYTSFSKHAIAKASSGVLPVELLNFDARKNQNKVDLIWSTASEINCDKFIVERGTNEESFTSILSTAGAGFSNSLKNYLEYDFNPYQGKNYYRLKQVDFDGKFAYSDIRVVDFDGKASMINNIYRSNDAEISIETDLNEKEASVLIYDASGRLLLNEKAEFNKGKATLNFDPHAAGVYLVRVVTPFHVLSGKIIY